MYRLIMETQYHPRKLYDLTLLRPIEFLPLLFRTVGVWGSEKMITTISPYYYISGSNHQGRGHQSSVTPFHISTSLVQILVQIKLTLIDRSAAILYMHHKISGDFGYLNRCLKKINKYSIPYSPVSRGIPPLSKKGIYAPPGCPYIEGGPTKIFLENSWSKNEF